jgi:hypothetical protein
MRSRFFTARRARRLDVVVVVWCVVWVLLAGLVAWDISNMDQFTGTVVRITDSLQQVTGSLEVLSGLPLVGGGIGTVVSEVDSMAKQAEAEAHDTSGSIDRVSIYAGVAVAILPTVMILLAYLPWRLPWGRDRKAIRAALAAGADDEVLDEYLARRAVETMSFADLRALGGNPFKQVAAGEYRVLADAELARLGISRR